MPLPHPHQKWLGHKKHLGIMTIFLNYRSVKAPFYHGFLTFYFAQKDACITKRDTALTSFLRKTGSSKLILNMPVLLVTWCVQSDRVEWTSTSQKHQRALSIFVTQHRQRGDYRNDLCPWILCLQLLLDATYNFLETL